MIIDLTGRKAIVTGSTAGIGRATAEGLARAGAAVVVNGRGNERVNEAMRQIRQAVPESDVSGVAADLSTAAGIEALVAQVPDADILVNNVGTAYIRDYSGIEDIARIPDEEWLALFQLNVMSGVRQRGAGIRQVGATAPTPFGVRRSGRSSGVRDRTYG